MVRTPGFISISVGEFTSVRLTLAENTQWSIHNSCEARGWITVSSTRSGRSRVAPPWHSCPAQVTSLPLSETLDYSLKRSLKCNLFTHGFFDNFVLFVVLFQFSRSAIIFCSKKSNLSFLHEMNWFE